MAVRPIRFAPKNVYLDLRSILKITRDSSPCPENSARFVVVVVVVVAVVKKRTFQNCSRRSQTTQCLSSAVSCNVVACRLPLWRLKGRSSSNSQGAASPP